MTWTLQSFYWLLKNYLIHICNVLCNVFHMNVFYMISGCRDNTQCTIPNTDPQTLPTEFHLTCCLGTISQRVYEVSNISWKLKILFPLILLIMIQSGHNFSHVMTCAKNVTWLHHYYFFYISAIYFSNFYDKLINPLWNESHTHLNAWCSISPHCLHTLHHKGQALCW